MNRRSRLRGGATLDGIPILTKKDVPYIMRENAGKLQYSMDNGATWKDAEFTGDATAGASHILSGQTAYVNGAKVTGTMGNYGSYTSPLLGSGNMDANAHSFNSNSYGYYGYVTTHPNVTGYVTPSTSFKHVVYGANPAVVKAGQRIGNSSSTVYGTFTSDANATTSQILSGRTAYVNGNKLTGTMPNRGTTNATLPINGSYTIPSGYHSGSGKVTQSIPTYGAQTITPGTTNKTLSAGRYLSGTQTIAGDPDLIPSNIRSGKNIFGVAGNLTEVKYASGTATSPTRISASLGWQPTLVIANGSRGGIWMWFDTSIHSTYISDMYTDPTWYTGNHFYTHPTSTLFHEEDWTLNTANFMNTSGFSLDVLGGNAWASNVVTWVAYGSCAI